MSHIEQNVAAHYGGPDLMAVLLDKATAPDGAIDPTRLELIDEFHVGGAAATVRVLDGLNLTPGQRLLDIGAGVGGTARRAARDYGAEVTGIDLTPGFVQIAKELTARTGIQPAPRFVQASALALPFPDGAFDAATMLHVGMNIADKPALIAEIARVLRPGGSLAVYDLMQLTPDDSADALDWPMPWAADDSTSFLTGPGGYRDAAGAAGLDFTAEQSRRDEALAFFAAGRAKAAEAKAAGLPPPLGVGTVMGDDAPVKLRNLAAAVERGVIAPVEMYFRKPLHSSHP